MQIAIRNGSTQRALAECDAMADSIPPVSAIHFANELEQSPCHNRWPL